MFLDLAQHSQQPHQEQALVSRHRHHASAPTDRFTDPRSPLPLRQRDTPPGRTPVATSVRKRQALSTPRSAPRDVTSSTGKANKRVEVVVLDEDSDGADDEDEEGPRTVEGRGRPPQKMLAAGAAAREAQGREESVEHRPAGRLWLARVESKCPDSSLCSRNRGSCKWSRRVSSHVFFIPTHAIRDFLCVPLLCFSFSLVGVDST